MTRSAIRHGVIAGLAALLLAATGASSALAEGPDPDAPPGAPPSWLPDEQWVKEHWLPYDETQLESRLGVSYADLRKWMNKNPRPLAVLIRQHELDPRRLASDLVRPARARVSPALYRELQRRALRTFTQQHLADHMFGHLFHQASWQRRVDVIFGVPNREVARRHAAGESFAGIAAGNGVRLGVLVSRISRVLRDSAERGIRTGQTPAAQGRRWYARQAQRLRAWLSRTRGASRARPAGPGRAAGAGAAGLLPVVGLLCRLH